LEKSEKKRLSVTVTGTYVNRLNHLVKEGIFMTQGEVFRESLRRTFKAYGIEPLHKNIVKKAEKN